jgi:predicted nucleic acid-binding protein
MTDVSAPAVVEIPGYRIDGEIGRGGIATVYRALQESLNRQVALKVMSPALAAEPNFSDRFIREGHIVAQFAHPHIVTTHDIGVSGFHHYIAMEYVEGGSLSARLGEVAAVDWGLAVIEQIALALGYAHEHGFVHRDVKPENILFRTDGSAVLTDFGIAKSTGSSTQLTSIGTIVGTPRYMSPEQAQGGEADPRSDIYALGVILYEILSGKPPFDKSESLAVLYAHINSPIPALPDDRCALQPLLNAMMEKNPENRVPDCDTLIELVQIARCDPNYLCVPQLLDAGVSLAAATPPSLQIPVEVAQSKRRQRRRAWWRRTARRTAWSFVVLMALAVGTVYYYGPISGAQLQTEVSELLRRARDVTGVGVLTSADRTSDGVGSTTVATPDTSADRTSDGVGSTTVATPDTSADSTSDRAGSTTISTSDTSADSTSDRAGSTTISTSDTNADSTSGGAGSTTDATSDGDFEVAGVSGETSRELDALLRRAQRHIDEGRLTEPPGANGFEIYQSILQSMPDNELAHAGVQEIADQFLILAQEQTTARQFDDAQGSLRRGLKVFPDHDGLLAYQANLERVVHANVAYREAEKYFFGDGVAVDYGEAARHYLVAAELGHSAAQTGIGVSYGNGYGVDASEEQAIRWLQRAASQGDAIAQYNLGLGLVFGTTVVPNEALQWAMKAAQQDYEPAYRLLSWMYQSGSGVEQSTKESLKWGIKSAFAPPPANAKVVGAWESRLAESTAVNSPRDSDLK